MLKALENFSRISKSVLSMNARNLQYLRRYNSLADRRFADNKLFSKQFLASRGIGVAKLYHHIKSAAQLTPEFFASLPKSFVIKPNKGFAGGGITVVVDTKDGKFITPSGKNVNQKELYRRSIEILEGKFSISGVGDSIIFEEILKPHSSFRSLTDLGLPDVRVIVFNLVPVLAMLRIPTHESEGKANMELGAIALGIDMVTGKTTGGAYYKKYIHKMPNGRSAKGFQVPYWDDILLACSQIQNATGIGFLGVDLVITPDGIKVLEVNARSGLKIQIANKVGLRSRLEMVKNLPIGTPEAGVETAKTLFRRTAFMAEENISAQKPIIGLMERGIINGSDPKPCVIRINPQNEKNFIKKSLFSSNFMDISLAGERIKIPIEQKQIKGADIELGAGALARFYIDPTKNSIENPPKTKNDSKSLARLRDFDEKLADLATNLKLLSFINPKNIAEQKKLFEEYDDYQPQFTYGGKRDTVEQTLSDLKKLPELDHPLFAVFANRREELIHQANMMLSVGTSDFSAFSKSVFGVASKYEYQQAIKEIEQADIALDESEVITEMEAKPILRAFLDRYKLKHWDIELLKDSTVDIQVTKRHKILLKKGATFTRNRLEMLLLHEIGTHVFRFENGKRQPWRILERGTANYLETEEGLAVFNQNQLDLPVGQKIYNMPGHIVAQYWASKMGFRETYDKLRALKLDHETAWRLTLKTKRGITNTKEAGAFTKDRVYWVGHRKVQKYLKSGKKMEDLYIGKVDIDELKLIQQLPGLVKPEFTL